jgi:hypothetical protein
VPYRLPKLIEAVNAGQLVYVVEGEKDVHAIERAGAVATCNPGGTGAGWRDDYDGWFTGAQAVIVADKDEGGRKHAAKIATHLRKVAKSVTVVEAAEGKDAADHLTAGHDLAGFQPVSDTSDTVSETETSPATSQSDTSDTSDSDTELLAGVRDGAWLTGQDFPPLAYAVNGLIPEGLCLLVGPPKAGKSWLTLGLLLAIASGGEALSHIKAAPARRVFYLALEDGDRRMQDRCRALLGPGEEIPALFHYQTRIMPGMVLPTVNAWMRRHPDTAMVVIDTLGKVMPPAQIGESAYQRDYRVGSALKALADARPGLAVVVLHHDRKATAEDFVDSVSGTHGLAGAADTVLVLCRKRQSPEGTLKVTGRDVPEAEYALKVADGKAWQLDGTDLRAAAAMARTRDESRSLGDKSGDVLAFVNKHPGVVPAAAAVDVFGDEAYQYLKRLADSGRIARAGRGKYTRLSELSEVSDSQVSDSDSESDSLSEVSETAPEENQ